MTSRGAGLRKQDRILVLLDIHVHWRKVRKSLKRKLNIGSQTRAAATHCCDSYNSCSASGLLTGHLKEFLVLFNVWGILS